MLDALHQQRFAVARSSASYRRACWEDEPARSLGLDVAMLLGSALVLTPVCYLVVTIATWVEYSEHPPTCFGIGGACVFDPETAGLVSAVLYACFLVVVLVVVGLLHFVGRRRLAVVRSCLAIAAVAFVWGWLALAAWVSAVRWFTPFM